MTRVAVIPARGGSKRIPRKNIRDFCGRPILAYSIDAARESGLFDRVIVSTDDEEIASIARAGGAETPFVRPAQLADDRAGTDAVVRHALLWLAGQGQPAEHVCCIYATAPFVRAADLQEGYRQLCAMNRAFAFAITTFEFPVQRALRRRADGGVEPFWPEHSEARSQDLEHAWHDAGLFYWGKAQAFIDQLQVYAPSSVGIPVPRHLAQDIDTEEDWMRAELMFEAMKRRVQG